jgi:hypothetical protein
MGLYGLEGIIVVSLRPQSLESVALLPGFGYNILVLGLYSSERRSDALWTGS